MRVSFKCRVMKLFTPSHHWRHHWHGAWSKILLEVRTCWSYLDSSTWKYSPWERRLSWTWKKLLFKHFYWRSYSFRIIMHRLLLLLELASSIVSFILVFMCLDVI
jgi:hypothetical protein